MRSARSRLVRLLGALFGVLIGGVPAQAQQLAGTVVRGDPRVPVGGVVLLAESPAGDSLLARTITGSRGQFALAVRAGAVRVRALRIGYRPAELGTFTLAGGEVQRVTLSLPENPVVLQSVMLRATARCDVVGEAGEAVATLFEEARKALVATQLVPADERPTALVALFSRLTEPDGTPRGEAQHRLVSGRSVRPFRSVSPAVLERTGYVVEEQGSTIYRAPDADVLLSEAFAEAHCLQLVEGRGERADWIGVGFRPVRAPRSRIGISGTLWLDRGSYELRRLEFGYVGLPSLASVVDVGGTVEFARLPDGLWIERRFELRMPRLTTDMGPRGRGPISTSVTAVERMGGEVLSLRAGDSLLFVGDSVLERRLLAAIGATGASVEGIRFGAIRGRLTDSLLVRGARALRGDTVVLRELGLRAVTDFDGAFEFKGIPAGTYRLTYRSAWLDTLRVGMLEHTVRVEAGVVDSARLSTPALATYQTLQCGAMLDSTDAVLVGEVTDGEGAPLVGATVIGRWRVWRIDGAEATQSVVDRTVSTGAVGDYVMCGVPKEARFDLEARASESDSAVRVSVLAVRDIHRRDLVIGAPTARVRVRGVVVGPDGAPLRRATVSSPVADASTATRTDGSFQLEVRGRRSQELIVRAIGFEPRAIEIDPRAAEVEVGDVMLSAVVLGLDTVRVVGRTDPLDWRPEFDRRRALGVGGFVSAADIAKMPRVTGNQIAQFARRVRVERDQLKLARGTGACYPRWFVDGVDEGFEVDERRKVAQGAGWAQAFLDRAKSVEVYSAAQAPPKFNDFDGCGLIVVWTR